jgi:hypothetical protein
MLPAPAAPIAARRSVLPGELSLSGFLALLAVVLVLVVVSLPRLRGIALQENEADARDTAAYLARALPRFDAGAEPPSVAEVLEVSEHPGGLTDAVLLEEGEILERHGYLFEVVRLPVEWTLASAALPWSTPSAARPPLAVRAWPRRHGSTGATAFVFTSAGGRFAHPNRPARWAGLEQRASFPDAGSGWRPVP